MIFASVLKLYWLVFVAKIDFSIVTFWTFFGQPLEK